MNINEAMQAAMNGDRVSWPGLGRDTFVEYDFNGFEKKHVKKFGEWASCTYIASDADNEAEWEISEYQPRQLDTSAPLPARIEAKWGGAGWGKTANAVQSVVPVAPKPVTGLAGFLAAQAAPGEDVAMWQTSEPSAAPEPKRDVWGRPID